MRAKIVARPEEYPWSSYRAYAGLSLGPTWLVCEWILSHFGPDEPQAQRRYRGFVEGGIGQEHPSPFEKVVASTLLGSESLVEWVQEEFVKKKRADRELPALRQISGNPSLEGIREAVDRWFGEDRAAARRVGLYLCHRTSGRKLKEIGAEFGVTESAVTQASRRVAEALKGNESLRQCVDELERDLDVSKV